MSRAGANYHIGRSTGICAATGTALTPGDPCVAAICEREEDDGFDRSDFSQQAWESGARPERLFSYWRTTVPDPTEKRQVFVNDDLLVNLFERLADDDRPQRIAFRFVIALVLMRKRLLKYEGRVGEGAEERWLMRPKGTPPPPDGVPIEVVNPHLSEEDVREISDQLGEILNGEMDA